MRDDMNSKDGIVLCEISYGSNLYELSKAFREEILRKPLGLPLSAQDLEGEEDQIHLAAVQDSTKILGTVILKQIWPDTMKLRQMAISPVTQGQGLGKRLVLLAEDFAKQNGAISIEMTARVSAKVFYERLGYHTTGPEFIDNAAPVPSIYMQKTL